MERKWHERESKNEDIRRNSITVEDYKKIGIGMYAGEETCHLEGISGFQQCLSRLSLMQSSLGPLHDILG